MVMVEGNESNFNLIEVHEITSTWLITVQCIPKICNPVHFSNKWGAMAFTFLLISKFMARGVGPLHILKWHNYNCNQHVSAPLHAATNN